MAWKAAARYSARSLPVELRKTSLGRMTSTPNHKAAGKGPSRSRAGGMPAPPRFQEELILLFRTMRSNITPIARKRPDGIQPVGTAGTTETIPGRKTDSPDRAGGADHLETGPNSTVGCPRKPSHSCDGVVTEVPSLRTRSDRVGAGRLFN